MNMTKIEELDQAIEESLNAGEYDRARSYRQQQHDEIRKICLIVNFNVPGISLKFPLMGSYSRLGRLAKRLQFIGKDGVFQRALRPFRRVQDFKVGQTVRIKGHGCCLITARKPEIGLVKSFSFEENKTVYSVVKNVESMQ